MMSDTKGPRFRNRSRHHPLGFFAEAQDPRAIVEVNTTAAKVRRSITEDEQLLIGTCSMTLRRRTAGSTPVLGSFKKTRERRPHHIDLGVIEPHAT